MARTKRKPNVEIQDTHPNRRLELLIGEYDTSGDLTWIGMVGCRGKRALRLAPGTEYSVTAIPSNGACDVQKFKVGTTPTQVSIKKGPPAVKTVVGITIDDPCSGDPCTDAEVEIWKKKSGSTYTFVMALTPTKTSGDPQWTDSVSLPAATYKFIATDLSASPHVCETQIHAVSGTTFSLTFTNLVSCGGAC
jgi:hypothetical protein